MNHIALAGVKHTGKSTKGRLLAGKHNGDFTDLDDLIIEKLPEGMPLREWYRENGQAAFMKLESQVLKEYLKEEFSGFRCLALGGATLENPEARVLLTESPICICGLTDREEVLYERILRKGLPPFLDPEKPRESFHDLYEKRSRTILEYSNIIIDMDGMSVDESVKAIDRAFMDFRRSRKKNR